MGKEEAKKPEHVDREELALRTAFASEGRAALIKKWWEAARPRREGAVLARPAGAKQEFFPLFRHWLRVRNLDDALVRGTDVGEWSVFRYARTPVVQEGPDWETAWHGTWWYALWCLLETGVMLESNDRSLGHDFTDVAGPGVYCSPVLETARWYARPTKVFNDGAWHKVMLELKVDPKRRRKERSKGGMQWVFPSDAVALKAVWVVVNASLKPGDERVREWLPEFEALPPGHSIPEATVNPRTKTEPWPSPTLMAMHGPAWEPEEETTTKISTVEDRLKGLGLKGLLTKGASQAAQAPKKAGRLKIALAGQPPQKDGAVKPAISFNGQPPQKEGAAKPAIALNGQQPQKDGAVKPAIALNGQPPQKDGAVKPAIALNGQPPQKDGAAKPAIALNGQQPQKDGAVKPAIALNGQTPQKNGAVKPAVVLNGPPAWALSNGRSDSTPSVADSGKENAPGTEGNAQAKPRLPLITKLAEQPSKLATTLSSLCGPSKLALKIVEVPANVLKRPGEGALLADDVPKVKRVCFGLRKD